jgi:putative peptidoglycan lipid II flippase
LFPAAIGTTIGQLITYVDMFFASGLGVGGWSAVTLSNRLVQLPLGVLQTALLVPIFPRFSRAAAEGNIGEIKHHFKTGVVSLWLISIPLLVLLVLFTEPFIRLVFEHGQFNAHATRLVSLAVVYQAFQIIPYFARDSLTRIFYAYQDARTPLLVGLFAILLKGVLNAALVPRFGVAGITLAITLVTGFNMLLLGFLSKRHIKDLGFKEMPSPFLKLALAGLLMSIATFYSYRFLVQMPFLKGYWVIYPALLLATLLGLGVYGVTVASLKVPEFISIRQRLLGRFQKK